MNINLTADEALVFFEWLQSIDSMQSPPFNHPAEQTVLWRIIGQLESTLTEPFAANYKDVVERARKRLEAM